MRLAWIVVGAAAAVACFSFAAQVDPALPAYRPAAFPVPKEVVRVVGYNDMREMLEPLARYFEATHPGLRMQLDLPGTRFAPAALARGESAFAPMGAVFTPPQLADYRAQVHADPIAFRVAHASLDPAALSGPLAVFVHHDNPLRSLTLEQAGRIFAGDVRTWGELGLEGEWSSRAVDAYGMRPDTALALEFQAAAMKDRDYGARVTGLAQSAEVVQKVGANASSIGFAAAMRGSPSVRMVPIAPRTGSDAVLPTEESIVAGRYPLDRYLLIYARVPLSPLAADFIRLVLSREGQQAVAATSQRYIPLSFRQAGAERDKLAD
jgi:phosphate transport system substrate-binding protein